MKKTKIISLLGITLVSSIISSINAGTLSIDSANSEIIKGCPTSIDVTMDTENDEIGTAEVAVLLNDSFTVNKFDSTQGVFRSYLTPLKNIARNEAFKGKNIMKFVGSTMSPTGYKGQGKFGSVVITPAQDAKTVEVALYSVENYVNDDSNLLKLNDKGTSEDALTKAVSKTFTVVDGVCPVDALPEIDLTKPAPTVTAQTVEQNAEETVAVNEQNVFDATQENNVVKKYRYIGLIFIAIAAIIVVAKKKKKKD